MKDKGNIEIIHKVYKMVKDEYISNDKSVYVMYALKELVQDNMITRHEYDITLNHFQVNFDKVPFKFFIDKILVFLFLRSHKNDENINVEIIERLIYITKST